MGEFHMENLIERFPWEDFIGKVAGVRRLSFRGKSNIPNIGSFASQRSIIRALRLAS